MYIDSTVCADNYKVNRSSGVNNDPLTVRG